MKNLFKKSLFIIAALHSVNNLHSQIINPPRYFGSTALFQKTENPTHKNLQKTPRHTDMPIEALDKNQNTIQTQYPKKQYIIAWDLHDVVLDRKHGSSAMGFISSGVYHYGFFKNFKHLHKITKIKNKYNKQRKARNLPEHSWEEMFYLLLRSPHTKEQFYGHYIKKCIGGDQCIVNTHVGIIIHELHAAGHAHAVLSNISLVGLQEQINEIRSAGWRTKLSPEQLQPLFEMLCDHTKRVTPHEHNNWAHKPEPDIYHEFLRKHKALNPDAITIFIDDKECNVRAAIEHGFDIGIVYKNPKELREALCFLGLL